MEAWLTREGTIQYDSLLDMILALDISMASHSSFAAAFPILVAAVKDYSDGSVWDLVHSTHCDL